MVKISLKKESRVKKQKQKQKQSQKVVINIGTNVLKPKRRRKTSGQIEKKGIDKQQPSGPVYVPQAMPVQQSSQPPNSMSEFVKYLKESEKQKEVAQEKEKKSNELEKEKKEEKRSEVLTRDEVQDNFSVVYPSSNFSSLTNSGTTTPLLSRPINQNLLFEALSREADLRSENPNSGKISLSTFESNPLSSSVSSTSVISNASSKETLDNILKNSVVTAVEDSVIDQVLEELPENQIVIYGPQRAGQTGTATEQHLNQLDIHKLHSFYDYKINKPLPTIRMADIIAENRKPLSLIQISEKQRVREARLKALEKKKVEPVLPNFTKEELDNYRKYFQQVEPVVEEESKKSSNQEDSPELIVLKGKLTDKNFSRKDMVNLLSKNGITEKDGLKYHIYKKNVNLGSNSATRTGLAEHILKEFNAGRITNLN